MCIDSTGSMARFWPYVLHNVEEISTRLVNFKVAHKFQNLNMKVRYAIILYKDFGDPAEVMNFCEISDPSKLLQRLQSIQPTGGDDVPEDLFGALESVLDLGWNHHNNSVKFLILFTDAPAHGKNYNSCPDDKFPDKKAPLEVFKKFNEMKLEFLFCTFDNVQTKETIISFSSPNHYANMKTVLLTRTPPRPQHFIFVLDQSSSMKGERWEYLKRAYKSFILQRQKDQGLKDRVTVITFTTTPIVVREYIPLSSALDIPLEQPSASWSPFGGTKFDPAINRIEPIIAKTIDTHLPVMIFMSDGGDKSSTSPNILTGYKKSYPTFVYHIIGFGLDTTTEKGRRNTAMLEEMGKEGKYFPSPTNESLLLVFQDIAKENQAFSTSIIEGVIYKSLEDKIVTDYL
uniref:VWFA domain-containing protein n=1 Tax=Arcella intermedia TaxID=1963864 RepID=A0A6B2L546_9EUKA